MATWFAAVGILVIALYIPSFSRNARVRIAAAWIGVLVGSALNVFLASDDPFLVRLGLFALMSLILVKATTYLISGKRFGFFRYVVYIAIFPAFTVWDFEWGRPRFRKAFQLFGLGLIETTFGLLLSLAVAQHSIDGTVVQASSFFLLLWGPSSVLYGLLAVLGFRVEPLMQAPYVSTSVRDFWSRRYNLPVRSFFLALIPRSLHAEGRLVGVFVLSAALHEYFVGFLIGPRYGYASAYFLSQLVFFAIEKRFLRRRVEGRVVGFAWALLAVVGPLWLFLGILYPTVYEQVWRPWIAALRAI